MLGGNALGMISPELDQYDKECGVSNLLGAHTIRFCGKRQCYFSFSATARGCFAKSIHYYITKMLLFWKTGLTNLK